MTRALPGAWECDLTELKLVYTFNPTGRSSRQVLARREEGPASRHLVDVRRLDDHANHRVGR